MLKSYKDNLRPGKNIHYSMINEDLSIIHLGDHGTHTCMDVSELGQHANKIELCIFG